MKYKINQLVREESNMKATNIKNGKRLPVMHGENFFIPIDKLPEGEIKEANIYIAGHSETGHHHILEATKPFKIVETETDRAILISEVTKLFHQKTFDIHETQFLAPGAYKIVKKKEYDPFNKVIRQIWD